jgi:hypothetical protein
MFCAPIVVFGGAECVGSRFHVLRFRTRFWRYRGRRVLFSCFARPDSFSAVPMASGPVFMFCTSILVFGGTKGVGSYFHVLRTHNHFRRFQVPRVLFSCFVLRDSFQDSFSALPGASGPVFLFCSPGLIFGGTDGGRSRFHAMRFRTHFRRYRGRRVLFHVLRARTHFLRYRGR